MRANAYDASRFGGKAGVHGSTADWYIREAETANRDGKCHEAEAHYKTAVTAFRKAMRAPTTPVKRVRRSR